MRRDAAVAVLTPAAALAAGHYRLQIDGDALASVGGAALSLHSDTGVQIEFDVEVGP